MGDYRHFTFCLLAVSFFIVGIEMAPSYPGVIVRKNELQLQSDNGLSSPLLVRSSSNGLNGVILPFNSDLDRLNLGRDDDDEEEKDDEKNENSSETAATTEATATTRQGFQNAQERVKDYGGGVLGIVTSAATLNLKGILHGSTQFIPPHIRVGVEDILGSIIGSPLDPNRFLVTSPPIPIIFTTEHVDTDSDYEKLFNNNRTIARPAIPQSQPDRNRIPVAETEATLTEVPITPAGSVPVPSSPPPPVTIEHETSPAVEVEAQESTDTSVVHEVDDNDIDDTEDEDSRSLFKQKPRLNILSHD